MPWGGVGVVRVELSVTALSSLIARCMYGTQHGVSIGLSLQVCPIHIRISLYIMLRLGSNTPILGASEEVQHFIQKRSCH